MDSPAYGGALDAECAQDELDKAFGGAVSVADRGDEHTAKDGAEQQIEDVVGIDGCIDGTGRRSAQDVAELRAGGQVQPLLLGAPTV